MAEALLISRADIFMRMVVGTHSLSSFAILSNALRLQADWASSLPALRMGLETYAPNYVVSDQCGESRCFKALPDMQMADIFAKGPEALKRSCGNPVIKATKAQNSEEHKCGNLKAVKLKEKSEL